jgi:hypothetical protein
MAGKKEVESAMQTWEMVRVTNGVRITEIKLLKIDTVLDPVE